MKLKQAILLLSIFIALIALPPIGYKFYAYYSPAKERTVYHVRSHNDDTLRIAYIGDSWADFHRNHKCLIADIVEEHIQRPVKVETFGIGGLTSKEIYHALFEIEQFKEFMEHGFDYCFISAGINDTNKKMSVAYYKESMNCIIRFMLANQIHPIILEIPDYDIHKSYRQQKTEKILIRKMSMLINNIPLDCKQIYRNALDELIREKGYEGEVSIVRYKDWNTNYEEDLNNLYTGDGMHLNKDGYERLDSCIARSIIKKVQLPI